MFFEKQIPDDLGLLLPPVRMTAHRRHNLGLFARATLAQSVSHYVLLEQFIQVTSRPIAWQQVNRKRLRLSATNWHLLGCLFVSQQQINEICSFSSFFKHQIRL